MSLSKIQWTDVTWNPVRGCSRVSPGCENCYAERYAARFSGPGLPWDGFAKTVEVHRPDFREVKVDGPSGIGMTTTHEPRWTGRVELVEKKLRAPLGWRRGRTPWRVFVNSMSDLFHESLPDEAIDRVFAVMALRPDLTFQILTKRPERMRAYFAHDERSIRIGSGIMSLGVLGFGAHVGFSRPLKNVWLGVSVEDQATADARIPILLDTPAAVRFVSAEPLLGPVDLECYPSTGCPTGWLDGSTALDWLIVGGESGPGARPCDVAWIRSIVAQCKDAEVACFVKQLGARPMHYPVKKHNVKGGRFDGAKYTSQVIYDPDIPKEPLAIRDRKGGDPDEWPEDLRVREFPNG